MTSGGRVGCGSGMGAGVLEGAGGAGVVVGTGGTGVVVGGGTGGAGAGGTGVLVGTGAEMGAGAEVRLKGIRLLRPSSRPS